MKKSNKILPANLEYFKRKPLVTANPPAITDKVELASS